MYLGTFSTKITAGLTAAAIARNPATKCPAWGSSSGFASDFLARPAGEWAVQGMPASRMSTLGNFSSAEASNASSSIGASTAIVTSHHEALALDRQSVE